jgi:hypothetical protein
MTLRGYFAELEQRQGLRFLTRPNARPRARAPRNCGGDSGWPTLSDPTTELYDTLTMGFLEDLIHLCERKGISLERVANCITGTRMREEWNWAYKYTRADRETNHGGSTRH